MRRLSSAVLLVTAFVVLRVALAGAVYFAVDGREFSGDVPLITFAAENPGCVWAGTYERSDRFFRDTVVNWGPGLGYVIAGPFKIFKSFVPDFLAIRFALIFLETVGFVVFYVVSRRGSCPSGGERSRAVKGGDPLRVFALSVWLPLGWVTTAVWVQEEILIAPLLFLAVVAAAKDRPGATAGAIFLAAAVSKFFVFGFFPAAWLVLRQRHRFVLYAALSLLPVVAYGVYVKARYGLLPFVGFDPASGPGMSLSLFTLYGQGRWLFDLPPLGQATGPIAKTVLAAALAGATWVGFKIVGSSPPREVRAGLRVWLLFAAAFLLFNCMGQPEYLAWYALLAPLLLRAVVPRRFFAFAVVGVVALCLFGWGWNFANAILVHGESAGGGFISDFAAGVISNVGVEAVRLVTFGSAAVYLALAIGIVVLVCRTIPRAPEPFPALPSSKGALAGAKE